MKYFILSIFGLALSVSSFAETNLKPVQVTAKGFDNSLYSQLTDIQTIYVDELLSMESSLSDIIADESGVQITQNGGASQSTNIQIDGINLKNTLVLLDGQAIGSATLGQASLNKIPVSQIERIEILKGNGSALYGSSAMGGVINLISKKNKANVSVSAGSFSTNRLEASLNKQSLHGFESGLTFSAQNSEGINSRTGTYYDYASSSDKRFDPDKDGSSNQSVSGYLNFSNNKNFRFENAFFFNQGEIEYDSSGSDNKADYETTQLNSKFSTQFDSLNIMALLSRQTDDATNFNTSTGKRDADIFVTTSHFINLQAQYTQKGFEILSGLDLKEDDISQSLLETKYEKPTINNKSLFTQMSIQPTSNIFMGLGARIDNNSAFGEHSTFNTSLKGVFKDHAITLSAESGFKAPSFNDLYYPGAGNPDLKPEESLQRSLRYNFSSSDRHFEAKIYQTDLDDLIAWAPAPTIENPYRWIPSNVNKSEIKGWRVSYQENFLTQFTSKLSASRTLSKNKTDDKQLALTPEYSVKVKLGYKTGSLDFSTSAIYVGEKLDSSRAEKLEAYTLVDMAANYQVTSALNTTVLIKNVLDKEYTPNTTYEGTPLNITINLTYEY